MANRCPNCESVFEGDVCNVCGYKLPSMPAAEPASVTVKRAPSSAPAPTRARAVAKKPAVKTRLGMKPSIFGMWVASFIVLAVYLAFIWVPVFTENGSSYTYLSMIDLCRLVATFPSFSSLTWLTPAAYAFFAAELMLIAASVIFLAMRKLGAAKSFLIISGIFSLCPLMVMLILFLYGDVSNTAGGSLLGVSFGMLNAFAYIRAAFALAGIIFSIVFAIASASDLEEVDIVPEPVHSNAAAAPKPRRVSASVEPDFSSAPFPETSAEKKPAREIGGNSHFKNPGDF